jgi:tetratricopeptide (TPR) repeat protein
MDMKIHPSTPENLRASPALRRRVFGPLAALVACALLLSACPSGGIQLEDEKRKNINGEVLPRTGRTEARGHFVKGNQLASEGRFKAAVRRYDKAIAKDPKFRDAYVNRGIAHMEIVRFDKALIDFAEALEIGPDDSLLYYNLGNAYAMHAQWEMAIKCYEKALELDDKDQGARNNLGNAFASANRVDDAIRTFEEFSRRDPDNSVGYNNLGVAYEIAGRQEDAIGAYRRAIQVDAEHPNAYMNLGKLQRQRGEACNAMATLSKFVKLVKDPDDIYRLKMEGMLGTLLAQCPSGARYINAGSN